MNAISENVKPKLITLVGPPNSGKTTVFNYLSGLKYKTVNYPGATIEYSFSPLLNSFGINANLLDSPGIVSLDASSPDEKVTIEGLFHNKKYGTPDLLIVTVDVSQLSRHLLLASQILATAENVIVVLTMRDLLQKKGIDINIAELEKELGCSVIDIDGRNGNGIEKLVESIKLRHGLSNKITFGESTELFRGKALLKIYARSGEIERNVLIPFMNPDFTEEEKIKRVNDGLNVLNQEMMNKPDARTIKIDRIFLHRFWGGIIFILLMGLIFMSIFWIASPLMKLVDVLFSYMSRESALLFGNNWVGNLFADGVIAGTGSVFVFLPQIIILFFIMGLLEDTGYLARGAMIVDKPLSKLGLNGRSFVPLLSGFACAIPAIMAARTIQNKKERLLTIFIIPLMSCSARLPVYSLLLAYLFPEQPFYSGITLAIIYLFSVTISLIIAGIVNRFQSKILKVEDNSAFIMELPAYRLPKLNFVFKSTLSNAGQYLKKAGPIILSFSLILWVLSYFPGPSAPVAPTVNKAGLELTSNNKTERIASSYAAKIGSFLEPAMQPIGMDWRIGVSLIATFSAREVFVSSLALIFKVTEPENDDIQGSILKAMKSAKNEKTGQNLFSTSTVAGLIVFFVFALQCMSTIAISRKESGSWRVPMLQILFFTSTAYIFAFLTVNGLRLIGIN